MKALTRANRVAAAHELYEAAGILMFGDPDTQGFEEGVLDLINEALSVFKPGGGEVLKIATVHDVNGTDIWS